MSGWTFLTRGDSIAGQFISAIQSSMEKLCESRKNRADRKTTPSEPTQDRSAPNNIVQSPCSDNHYATHCVKLQLNSTVYFDYCPCFIRCRSCKMYVLDVWVLLCCSQRSFAYGGQKHMCVHFPLTRREFMTRIVYGDYQGTERSSGECKGTTVGKGDPGSCASRKEHSYGAMLGEGENIGMGMKE